MAGQAKNLSFVGIILAVFAALGSGFLYSDGTNVFSTNTGDVTISSGATVAGKLKGTAITTAGGALATGAVLRTTGAAAADWGQVNLADTDAVVNVLPAANQAAQTISGDGTGNTGALVVTQCTGSGGICTVPSGTALKVGASTVAAAGDIRLGTSGSVKALSGASDVNMCSVSSGVITYGGTANSGVNIGTSTGSVINAQVNGTTVASIGATYASVGTNPAASGTLRTPNNVSALVARNAANSADLDLVAVNASNGTTIGNGSGTLTLSATSSGVFIGTTLLTYSAANASPVFSHAPRTSDAAVTNLIVRAQNAWASASTNINGGQHIAQGGTAKTDGSSGLRKGFRADLSSNAVTMIEATEVIAGNKVLALVQGAPLSTTEMPASTGDKVVFIANATSVPSANAVGGGILYVEGGALKYRGAGGTVTTVGPNFAIPYLEAFADLYPANDNAAVHVSSLEEVEAYMREYHLHPDANDSAIPLFDDEPVNDNTWRVVGDF